MPLGGMCEAVPTALMMENCSYTFLLSTYAASKFCCNSVLSAWPSIGFGGGNSREARGAFNKASLLLSRDMRWRFALLPAELGASDVCNAELNFSTTSKFDCKEKHMGFGHIMLLTQHMALNTQLLTSNMSVIY